MDWDDHPIELSEEHTRLLRILTGLGVVTIGFGLWLAPVRVWANLLLVSYYLIGLALAGMVFIALQYVGGADGAPHCAACRKR